MSLLSVDITKVKRLSLKEVKLSTKERIVERPPTDEEIKKIELREDIKPQPELEIKELDKPKLIALAQRVIEGENSYTMEEAIERIKEATNVNYNRAERGFKLILQAGAIEPTLVDRYYLTGSTPF